ncbi:MAG: hypothetical protein FJY88_06715 [Candidatus Eisenbacteria bacterium]|nr:hypothetical protein [Candidatus Eisenbacteria bacterium]
MTEHCETYLRLFDRYLDGDLDPEVTRQMEEHLAACAQCRTAQEQMRATDGLLRRYVLAETEELAREEVARERLLARLRQEPDPAWMGRDAGAAARPPRRFWSGLTLRWAGGLVAATAAVILAIRLGMPPRETWMKEEAPPAGTNLREDAARDEALDAPQAAVAEREAPQAAVAEREPPQAAVAQVPDAPQEAVAERDAPQAAVAEREAPPVAPPPEHPRASSRPVQADDAGGAPAEPKQPVVEADAKKELGGLHLRGGRSAEAQYLVTDAPVSPNEAKGAEPSGSATPLAGQGMEAKALRTWGSVSSTRVGRVSAEDTLAAARDLESRLEEEDAYLSGPDGAAIEPATRAARYILIGDLWEWLGRTWNNPAFCARALRAYEKAVEADSAVAPDPARVHRARQMTKGKDSWE